MMGIAKGSTKMFEKTWVGGETCWKQGTYLEAAACQCHTEVLKATIGEYLMIIYAIFN